MASRPCVRTPAVLLASALLALSAFTSSHAALNNEVTAWLYEAQKTVAALGIPNQLSGRLYGTVGLSALEAYNAARKAKSADTRAAVIYSAHYALSTWFPWRQTGLFDPLIARQIGKLNLTEAARSASESAGVHAAKGVLKGRSEDGTSVWARFVPAPFNTTASRGKYQATPGQTTFLYPQLGKAKPFFLAKDQLAALQKKYVKHDLSSPAYLKDLDEVTAYGDVNSTLRSAYDSNSPRFWALGSNTSAVAGAFLNISYALLPADLSLEATVRFYAAFGAAAFDASVACWAVKYTQLFWRPVTAIRFGDPRRPPQPNWQPQEWTPVLSTPGHPEYPSGHQCTAGAVGRVLAAVLGGDKFNITLTSEGAPDLTRSYTSLNATVYEVGDSRLLGGVHFRKANEDGTALGRAVASLVLKSLGYK